MAADDPILLQILREDPEIKDAEARYQQFVADDELRARYEGREKFLRDWLSLAEERRQEGLAEGRDVGRQEGRLLERRDMLIRLMETRFGMTRAEQDLVHQCSEPDLLMQALDKLADPEATKESVLKGLN